MCKYWKNFCPEKTKFKGSIKTTYDNIKSVLGNPRHGPDKREGKITCEWMITLPGNPPTNAIIYDWNNSETPRTPYRWRIGSTSKEAAKIIQKIFSESI